jgi:cytidylate kinase
MPVITLSRELGSRGDDIAAGVAERLRLRLVGRDLINEAARQAGVPEVALAEIDELGLLGVKPSREAMRLYRQTAEQIIHARADEGNVVLVGRGSQIALAGRPGILHLRIIAPLTDRIHCLQERSGIAAEAAAARIATSDRMRADYLLRHYGTRWDAPENYDLIINTARLSVETAIALICHVADQAPYRDPQ